MGEAAVQTAVARTGIELLTGSTQTVEKLPILNTVLGETGSGLAQLLQASPTSKLLIKLSGTDTGKAGEVLGAHAESVAGAAIRSDQWDGPLLVGVDRFFLFALIDMLFGGDGAEAPYRAERPITKIETEISKWFFTHIVSALSASFGRLAPSSFALDRIDFPPAFDALGRPSAPVAAATYELQCAGGAGRMFIALPQSALGFLRAHAPREAPEPASASPDPTWTRSLGNRVSRAGISLKAILGTTELKLGDIASLQVGQILRLDPLAQNRVRLDCKGQPLYWCKLGQADGVYTLSVDRPVDHEQEFMDDILSH